MRRFGLIAFGFCLMCTACDRAADNSPTDSPQSKTDPQQNIKRAHVSKAIAALSTAKPYLLEYYGSRGRFPSGFAAAGMDEVTIKGMVHGAKSLTLNEGVLTLTFNEQILDNATLRLSPEINGRQVRWRCSADKALRDKGYVGAECQ